jgi:P2 family phage contractile tail tube protein
MADKMKVNRLTNANVYADGKSLLGKAEEISLPDIKHIMSEHKAMGMVGKLELWAGVDKMEAKIKWNSFYIDVMKKFADPTKAIQLQIRGNLETYESAGRTNQQPVVCFITCTSKNFPLGNYKQHDNVELETMLNVTYCRQEINREIVMEIDVMANIYKVNGVDILAEYRANIGG